MVEILVGTHNGVRISTSGYGSAGGILLWNLFDILPVKQLYSGTAGIGYFVSDVGMFND